MTLTDIVRLEHTRESLQGREETQVTPRWTLNWANSQFTGKQNFHGGKCKLKLCPPYLGKSSHSFRNNTEHKNSSESEIGNTNHPVRQRGCSGERKLFQEKSHLLNKIYSQSLSRWDYKCIWFSVGCSLI